MNNSSTTARTKRTDNHIRSFQRTTYYVNANPVCRTTFKFLHVISQDKLTALLKWYKDNGLQPRRQKKSGGRVHSSRVLSFQDVQNVVTFLLNYAEVNAIVLPGRIATFKRWDVKVLPSSETRSSVWRKYSAAMANTERRAVGNSTFRKLWRQLVPNIVITKPRSDICLECHQYNNAIYRSANLPEGVKSAKLQKQEQHLLIVTQETSLYRDMVESCKDEVKGCKLGKTAPISRPGTVHYSFDFAQVHYLSDPLQPGPIYFLCPRKCGVFGVCCEGVPQQVNFLIDEYHCSTKGANSVISYLDYFFENFGLGECTVHLHCDNCSGQNKNKYMIWYLMWRCCVGLHENITLNFLITGHTKFSPDWCFGLFKQSYRRNRVSCLNDIAEVVNKSTVSGVNVAQLVGDEQGNVTVPCKNWQLFLQDTFKPLPGIKGFHHFRFSRAEPGVVFAKLHSESEEQRFELAKKSIVFRGLPPVIPSPGLDRNRQQYLFNIIKDYCKERVKDLVCPEPEPAPEGPNAMDMEIDQLDVDERASTAECVQSSPVVLTSSNTAEDSDSEPHGSAGTSTRRRGRAKSDTPKSTKQQQQDNDSHSTSKSGGRQGRGKAVQKK